MRWLVLLLVLGSAGPVPAVTLRTYYPAQVLDVHDADTLLLEWSMGFELNMGPQMTRLGNGDAWEVDKSRKQVEPFKSFTPEQWKEEIAKGRAARDALRTLLATGKLWVAEAPGRDPYGRPRTLWFLQVDRKVIDLTKWLREQGHLRDSPPPAPPAPKP